MQPCWHLSMQAHAVKHTSVYTNLLVKMPDILNSSVSPAYSGIEAQCALPPSPPRCYPHRWASTLISMSAISDIQHRHLLFRYRSEICRTEKHHSDIGSVPISTSEFIPISDIEEKKYFSLRIRTCTPGTGKRAL